MMPETESPWFRFGHAFERTVQSLSSPGSKISSLRDRRENGTTRKRNRRMEGDDGRSAWHDGRAEVHSFGENLAERVKQALEHLPIDEDELAKIVDALFAAGAGTLMSRLLERVAKGGSRSVNGLVKAGVAGAAAALLVQALRPLLERDGEKVELDAELAYALMEGAGRGLIYGTLLHRRIPGPSVMRGAIYGGAEYLVGPWGGISQILHPLTPQSTLPLVGTLLEPGDASESTLVEHLVFGSTLGMLYGLGED